MLLNSNKHSVVVRYNSHDVTIGPGEKISVVTAFEVSMESAIKTEKHILSKTVGLRVVAAGAVKESEAKEEKEVDDRTPEQKKVDAQAKRTATLAAKKASKEGK